MGCMGCMGWLAGLVHESVHRQHQQRVGAHSCNSSPSHHHPYLLACSCLPDTYNSASQRHTVQHPAQALQQQEHGFTLLQRLPHRRPFVLVGAEDEVGHRHSNHHQQGQHHHHGQEGRLYGVQTHDIQSREYRGCQYHLHTHARTHQHTPHTPHTKQDLRCQHVRKSRVGINTGGICAVVCPPPVLLFGCLYISPCSAPPPTANSNISTDSNEGDERILVVVGFLGEVPLVRREG
mmetsp:Transcript_3820/g.7282  ORF Transcript_3820/g.7282 Transcript_3820/m.7282 type:complete len:235 (+) Transcript_3820:1400-2104(+)